MTKIQGNLIKLRALIKSPQYKSLLQLAAVSNDLDSITYLCELWDEAKDDSDSLKSPRRKGILSILLRMNSSILWRANEAIDKLLVSVEKQRQQKLSIKSTKESFQIDFRRYFIEYDA